MSSALTGNKIKDSYQALLKIGTNGSLDPTTAIAISDGLGNDTPLQLAADKLLTNYLGFDIGLKLDFQNYISYLGDFNNYYNGASFVADYNNGYIYTLSGGSTVGLFIDGYNEMKLGDFNNLSNGNSIFFNNAANLIYTKNLGNDIGFKFDYTNNIFQFGDFSNITNNSLINIDNNIGQIYIQSHADAIFIGDGFYNYNNTCLVVNDNLQNIKTSNNGNDIGLKLDFANSNYLFGDFNSISGYQTNLQILPANKLSQLISSDNWLELDGYYNNVWLGNYPGSYSQNNSAVTNNYMLGTDWYMDNSNDTLYPFTYNTILNCYNNNLDTSSKAMSYNFYSNIKGNNFTIPPSPDLSNGEIISNCFIFGIDASNDATYIRSFSIELNETNTNVVLFNGKALSYGIESTNIFSVNSSGTVIEQAVSGVTILGGDFFFAKDKKLIKANHQLDSKEAYGINITGMRAIARNSFSNVFATRMDGSNAIGQVQVEQIQLSSYFADGSITGALVNAVGDVELYVQSSSTYQVEAKIVSTIGNGQKGHSGNSYVNATWKVCVDSIGNVDISDYCTGCVDNPSGSTTFELISTNDNRITIRVAPDVVDGNECYVKALMTLNCIVFG